MIGVTLEYLQAKLHPRFDDGWSKWISVGSGWYGLLLNMDEALNRIAPDYRLQQVKEKFGTLRFYASYGGPADEVDKFMWNAIIRYGESISGQICEDCGDRHGQQKEHQTYVKVTTESTYSAGGWIHTLCSDCRKIHYDRIHEEVNKQKRDK